MKIFSTIIVISFLVIGTINGMEDFKKKIKENSDPRIQLVQKNEVYRVDGEEKNREHEIIVEKDLELGGYRANLLTPETISKLGFLKKQTLTEWADSVKKNKVKEPIENHLVDLFWQYFTISKSIENNKLDTAYEAFKKVKTLHREVMKCKDPILYSMFGDTFKQLAVDWQPFVDRYGQETCNILENNDIDDHEELDEEKKEMINRQAWNRCTNELVEESEERFAKVVLVGAALNDCKPEAWMQKIQKQLFLQGNKELGTVKSAYGEKEALNKKGCILN